MLQDPRIKDPKSDEGKLFRRRFRVPFPIFERLTQIAVELGFPLRPRGANGRRGVPLELKVLGVLRVLGRGTCFDGIQELSKASAEVMRTFFHKFCRLFSEKYFAQYVHPPEGDEIASVMRVYERQGLPGCLGSTDCVHVRWDMCPTAVANFCCGKEGYPTLAWMATVDHHLKFRSVSKSFYGATNDKTICKYDSMVLSLRSYGKYDEVDYALVDGSGEQFMERVPYLISDNGFMKWRCLIPPMRYPTKHSESLWSCHVESIRKDVERSFGILKGRFRCLKIGLLFHYQEDIDFVFFTCVVLHNMILSFDGRDRLWEDDVCWQNADGEFDDDTAEKLSAVYHRAVTRLTDFARVGSQALTNDPEEETDPGFHDLRRKLITNFAFKYFNIPDEIEWLN
jgi:hypothetical protein